MICIFRYLSVRMGHISLKVLKSLSLGISMAQIGLCYSSKVLSPIKLKFIGYNFAFIIVDIKTNGKIEEH